MGDDVATIARNHAIVNVIEMPQCDFAWLDGGLVTTVDGHQLRALGNIRVAHDAVATHFAGDGRRRDAELARDGTLGVAT